MKVKNLPQQTLRALNNLIYGTNLEAIQRGPEGAYAFLSSAGLPCGEAHFAKINANWVEDRLLEYNRDEEQMTQAILHIVSWSHFLDKPERFEPTLNRLQLILAPAGWTVEMDGIIPYLRQIPPSFRLEKRTALPMEPTPDFSKIRSEKIWVEVLRARWDEAERCIAADAPVAAIVMLGSILEGALKATIERFPREANQSTAAPRDDSTGNVKPFREWTFSNLIQVAENLGWIGADTRRMGDALRDYRNLVHPGEQVKSKEFPTRDSARLCRQVVVASLRTLVGYLENRGVVAPN